MAFIEKIEGHIILSIKSIIIIELIYRRWCSRSLDIMVLSFAGGPNQTCLWLTVTVFDHSRVEH